MGRSSPYITRIVHPHEKVSHAISIFRLGVRERSRSEKKREEKKERAREKKRERMRAGVKHTIVVIRGLFLASFPFYFLPLYECLFFLLTLSTHVSVAPPPPFRIL